jgi:hypothetical protein
VQPLNGLFILTVFLKRLMDISDESNRKCDKLQHFVIFCFHQMLLFISNIKHRIIKYMILCLSGHFIVYLVTVTLLE